MRTNGKFLKNLPIVSGESQRGPWVRGGFVIETFGDYPHKIAFTTFGEDRVRMTANIPQGTPVDVTFQPESREYEDKWYTELRASRVEPMAAQVATQPAPAWPQAPVQAQPAQPMTPQEATANMYASRPAVHTAAPSMDDSDNDLPWPEA